jgi:hypothetical protein
VTELPWRVVCIGAGIVNCELAQAFRRLGSEVDLVGSGDRLLPSEAPAASDLLAGRLAAEGLRLRLGQRVTAVDGGRRRAVLGDGTELPYDALMLATGRRVGLTACGTVPRNAMRGDRSTSASGPRTNGSASRFRTSRSSRPSSGTPPTIASPACGRPTSEERADPSGADHPGRLTPSTC